MKGQLSEQPLAELIREISSKSFSGRLLLEHDRVKVVVYFDNGNFLYAGANLRTVRLREYLLKSNLLSEQDLAQFNDRVPDLDMLKVLCTQKLLTPAAAEQVQTKQASDVLCLGLLWTEGSWEFDPRSRLSDTPRLSVDMNSLLLEAGRRLPAQFAASRFRNPAELITPLATPMVHDNLMPAEVFLLSRLDKPTVLRDLIALGGASEEETLSVVYALALGGLLKRERWQNAFRDPQRTPASEADKDATANREHTEVDLNETQTFLTQIKNAQTHYEVLNVGVEVTASELKSIYYHIARRYHPDRFRSVNPSLVPQLEAAFAKISQAYDTLRDDNLRANYNSKLEARRKADQLVDTVPKPATPQTPHEAVVEGAGEVDSKTERAASQFKEGLAALELGEKKTALGLFAAAATAVPSEARYRAFYGHLLAGDERTRRVAEGELQAALKIEPNNAEYRVMLSELYRDLGLRLRARGEAERAVAADPNNQKARELLRALG